MSKQQRNFAAGIMNKSVDERLLKNGEYADAVNVRLGSTEDSEIGSVENAKGNEQVSTLVFPITGLDCSTPLSDSAVCVGKYGDTENETIYWFVHDPKWTGAYDTGAPNTLITSGTTTSVLPNKLVDNTVNFKTLGVTKGDKVRLTATPTVFTYVTSISGDGTELTLSNDIFTGPAPQAYQVVTNTQRCDMIVSFNTNSDTLQYHIVSLWDGVVCSTQYTTTLNFNPKRLITGINLIDDMLFFTDNYNSPRKININKQYPYPTVSTGVAPVVTCSASSDNFTKEEIQVIKAPPPHAPILVFNDNNLQGNNQKNYLENRLICFAYRFKYDDGEYSALSQFTDPAFVPNSFFLSPGSLTNEGMTNKYREVTVKYTTGDATVVGIDVVFKEADNPIIKVIEKIDKLNSEGGGIIENNITQEIVFDNSKIYTVLPNDEILRLYDNVPRIAKAQTLMGNRLMYGNYVDGYNLINKFGQKVEQEWTTELTHEIPGNYNIPVETQTGYMSTFKFGNTSPCRQNGTGGGGTYVVPRYRMYMDFSNIPLLEGSTIRFRFNYTVDNGWNTGGQCWYDTGGVVSSTGPAEDALSGAVVEWTFVIDKNYDTIKDLFDDSDNSFRASIGYGTPTTGNIQPPMSNQYGSSSGSTLTDLLNSQGTAFVTADSSVSPPVLLYRSISGDSLPCPTVGGNNISTNNSIGLADYVTFTTPAGTNNNNIMSFKILPLIYTENAAGQSFDPCAIVWPSFTNPKVTVESVAKNRSLHSNRGYELGIVYMDEYKRSTTALTSPFNSVSTLCSHSSLVNKIKITIPESQRAPKWAKSYKFVIKPDEEKYETIYSTRAYRSSKDSSVWLLLDGENAPKVEVGDRLICKKDVNGPVSSCEYAKVLQKGAQEKAFILPLNPQWSGESPTDSETEPGTGSNPQYLFVPQGVYMQLKNVNFSIATANNVLEYPTIPSFGNASDTLPVRPITQSDDDPTGCPFLKYKGLYGKPITNTDNNVLEYPDLPIPQGTVVRIIFRFEREGNVSEGSNNRRIYNYDKTFTADAGYANMKEFWDTVGIGFTLGQGSVSGGLCSGDTPLTFTYITEAMENYDGTGAFTQECTNCDFYCRWATTSAGELQFLIRGASGGGTALLRSKITATFDISFTENTLVFETEPQNALPNVWYEGSQNYSINQSTGGHNSGADVGDRNQVPGIPGAAGVQSGVINLDFFNCFTFGNGVESFKIRDSFTGTSFALGNRVTSTSQDYGMERRYASISYSGVYNDASNVNRLNEFNLGLLNYKNLEDSFGHIQILSGRETDVLVLQEDKISYVLAGKNLLSDSTGGGSVASIPEVLGTQIARVEEYGISKNPESFTVYGFDKYFTDQKRGAVLKLRGSAGQNEQLSVISNFGMRSWFRDVFNGRGDISLTATDSSAINFTTQKIGGFDPYMNEYVVSFNDNPIIIESLDPCDELAVGDFVSENDFDIIACGTETSITSSDTTELSQVISLGSDLGQVTWTFTAVTASYTISLTWNNTVAASGTVTPGVPLSLSFTRNAAGGTADNVFVSITPSGVGTLTFTPFCPVPVLLNTIPVVLRPNYPQPLNTSGPLAAFATDTNNSQTLIREFQWTATTPLGETTGPLNYATIEMTDDVFGNNNFPRCSEWNTSNYSQQVQGVAAPPNGATMEVVIRNLFAIDSPENEFNITTQAFDANVNRILFMRTPTPYSQDNSGAISLVADAIAAGNIISNAAGNLQSWNGQEYVSPAVSNAGKYRGVFTVPTPVAPATDPYLYIVLDFRQPTNDNLCFGVSPSDVCCSCECPVGSPNVCYQIVNSNFGQSINPTTGAPDPESQAPSVYTYNYTDTAGVAQTLQVPAASGFDSPSVVFVCSQTYPILTGAEFLPTQWNGNPWPYPVITTQGCFPGACTCP